jgi:hypothetical protein
VILVAIAALAAIAAISVRRAAGPEEASSPPSAPRVASPDATAEPSPEPREPAPRNIELSLSLVGGPSWVRVTEGDEVVLEGTEQPGFSRTFRARRQLHVELGNASAAELKLGGRPFEIEGDEGGVYRASFVMRNDRIRVVPLLEA